MSSTFQIAENLSHNEDIRRFSCVALLSLDCTLEAYEAIFFVLFVSSDINPIVSEGVHFFASLFSFYTQAHSWTGIFSLYEQ